MAAAAVASNRSKGPHTVAARMHEHTLSRIFAPLEATAASGGGVGGDNDSGDKNAQALDAQRELLRGANLRQLRSQQRCSVQSYICRA